MMRNKLIMHNKNYFRIIFLVFLLFLLAHPLLFAQKNGATNNNILKVKSTSDFNVTGEGTSENWKSTEWNTLLQHNTTTLKNAGWNVSSLTDDADIRDKTLFKVLYSKKGIYCLFKCEDSVI